MNIAAKVAADKRNHPDDFCSVKGCLWRVYTKNGYRPCEKHSPIAAEWHDPAKCDHPECRASEAKRDAAREEGSAEGTRRVDGAMVVSPAARSLTREERMANHDPRTCDHPHCRLAF